MGDDNEDDEAESEELEPEIISKPSSSKRTKVSTKKKGTPAVSSQPVATTLEEDLSNEEGTVSEEPVEDEDALIEQLNSALSEQDSHQDQRNLSSSGGSSAKPSMRACPGECRNIIFGLFLCDEIDNDAFCSETGLACCVNNNEQDQFDNYKPYGNGSSEETGNAGSPEINLANDHDNGDDDIQHHVGSSGTLVEDDEEDETDDNDKTRHQDPKHGNTGASSNQQSQGGNQQVHNFPQQPPPHKLNTRLPPPPHHLQHHPHHPYNPQGHYYFPQNGQGNNPPPPMLMHHPPPNRMPPLPCPRYCVKTFLDSYCSDKWPAHFACGMDGFCCGHDVPVNTIKDQNNNEQDVEDEDRDSQQQGEGGSGTGGGASGTTNNKIIGPCTEEVGSCVSKNIIGIICFGELHILVLTTDLETY